MSLGITATNLAGASYSSYIYANSANGKKYAASEADIAKNDYGVSNLSNGLDSLDFSSDMDGMTTVDAYAKAHYLTSQTTVYDSPSASVDFSTLSGTASSYADTAYTAQKMGLSSSSSVDLYGITTAANTARINYSLSEIPSSLTSSSDALSTYQKYLSNSTYSSGSLLNTAA